MIYERGLANLKLFLEIKGKSKIKSKLRIIAMNRCLDRLFSAKILYI